ncbi:unnamed protein product [Brassica rapa subsp. narinosa]
MYFVFDLCYVYTTQSCRLHNSVIPQTYPKIRKCLDNSTVSEEDMSKKKRRLSEKKKKCRTRLVFVVVTDIELVAVYTCRRHPCFRFSDPSLQVSVFTVFATTTACHHTEELDGGGGNKTVVWLEDIGAHVVTGLRRRRKKTPPGSRDMEETHGGLVRFRFCRHSC